MTGLVVFCTTTNNINTDGGEDPRHEAGIGGPAGCRRVKASAWGRRGRVAAGEDWLVDLAAVAPPFN